MKKTLLLLLLGLAAASSQASVLLQDSANYPYTNGPIAGQGQWYVYSPATPKYDTIVSNNVIYMTSTNKDTIATPTNGFYTATNGSIVWASFTLNVSKLPDYNAYNDGYFCQFISTNKNTCCNLFIDQVGTVVPGTFRLSIANFSVSFSNLQLPVTYPLDLVTNVPYNIVIAYDTQVGSYTEGANLLINPSPADFDNLFSGASQGSGFVYGTDIAVNAARADIEATAISFSPYVNAGISNVIVGTSYEDISTNLNPLVFGIQPVSGSTYSGNDVTLMAVAAGSDVTYQWYSSSTGLLADNANITGSTSNVLVLSNVSATDGYYVVATDANNNSATSTIAVETVNTTPTPVFFDPSVTSVKLTNNLFTTVGFTNQAYGTGPISYQWYFKGTNASATFAPLAGQNGPSISLNLADYTYGGQYYVVAANGVNGGTTATGPTNTLVEIAPAIASIQQLHTYVNNNLAQIAANPGGTVFINTNNVTVSGYVSPYRGYGSTYTTFFIQDTNSYGVEIFLAGKGNTNAPPVGSYVTVSAPLEVYHSALEMVPASQSAITVTPALPVGFNPILGNPLYRDFSTNAIGSNAVRYCASLVTFTNVYIYGTATGGALGTGPNNGATSGVGGIFTSNSYCILFMTVGAPYNAVANTNTMEIFQPTYDYRNADGSSMVQSPFDFKPIPTHCTQLTGVLLSYGGSPSYVEVIPSRYVDYVTNDPTPVTVAIGTTNKTAALNWSPIPGYTYSVVTATNLNGPWKNESTGLTYYPTNGVYTQPVSPAPSAKFFKVTTP